MRSALPASDDPRDVLRGLRDALLGDGPALALGGRDAGTPPPEVPAGTAVVITTSGSTGVPKAVVLSRQALAASATATADRLGSGAWLLALPPTYVAGAQVLVRSLIAGRAPVVLPGPFRPDAFVAAARETRSTKGGTPVPTFTSLVPVQLHRLLDAASSTSEVADALRSFDAILVGGQALPPSLRERAAELGAHIVRTYGSTETSGGCVYDGRPLGGVRLRIADGEVQVAGPVLAEGYLEQPELTASVFVHDPDGVRWYRTGDAGEVDDEGVLAVAGRLDNVIVSGGVNISLDRVERAVRALTGFEQAVVVGVPDATWGEASVVVLPAAALAGDGGDVLERVRSQVEEEVGRHARPVRVRAVAQIPLLPSGKPDRTALRALAASAG